MTLPAALVGSHGIRHLRVRTASGADALRSRLAVERELAAAQWQPLGVSADAVLLVRRLAFSTTPGRPLAPRLSETLRLEASRARRPWLHGDAPGEEAVLFADEAELLACLVRDWLGGGADGRWWWRMLLGAEPPGRWLARQLYARGDRLVPVAARLIGGDGRAAAGAPGPRGAAAVAAWFGRIDDAQAAQAAGAVALAHAMAPAAQRPAAPAADAVGAPRRCRASAADAATRGERPALARLHEVVPELARMGPGPGRRRLLAYVVALVRAPGWARSAAFSRALALLDHGGDGPSAGRGDAPAEARGAGGKMAAPSAAGPPAGRRDAGSDAGPAASRAAAPIAARRGGNAARPHRRRRPPAVGLRGAGSDAAAVRRTAQRAARSAPRATPAAVPARGPAFAPEPASATTAALAAAAPDAAPRRPDAAPAAVVRTAFGGLFYLLNAALALGLYADFSAPRTPGLALSPWDLLAWIGRRWFGRPFMADPLWPLLAALAGRPAAPPRSSRALPGDLRPGFTPPAEWVVDPAWLVPWGRVGRVRVETRGTRLRLIHPAGFVLFDVARERGTAPLAQALRLCARTRGLEGAAPERAARVPAQAPARAVRSVAAGPPAPVAPGRGRTGRWLDALLGCLQARCALALGLADAREVPALLCRHAASVRVDDGTVVVELGLAELPIAIRIAGLDCDAGWIPAAGRSLRFRFT